MEQNYYFVKANALIEMHTNEKSTDNHLKSKYLEEAIECFEKAVNIETILKAFLF